MKKYLSGAVALILAIVMVAFTNKPTIVTREKSSPTADPCSPSSKKWFIINLECDEQGEFSYLTNAGNYTPVTAQQASALCTGSQCVCAILACPTNGGLSPIISPTTLIYQALDAYWRFGTTHAHIKMKDPVWQRR